MMKKEMKITSDNVELMWPAASEPVLCYMRLIVKDLEDQYDHDIPDYMIIQLDLLYDLITLYKKAQKEQAGKPLVLGDGARQWQSPQQLIIRETSKQMLSLMKEMGLTIFSKERVKLVKDKVNKTGNTKDEKAKELMNKLLS